MKIDQLTLEFQAFLTSRPAISPARLAKELGIDKVTMGKIQKSIRNIPRHRRGDFAKAMRHYGHPHPLTPIQITKL